MVSLVSRRSRWFQQLRDEMLQQYSIVVLKELLRIDLYLNTKGLHILGS